MDYLLYSRNQMATTSKKKFVTFEGHDVFRMRIVCSLLTGNPIRIHGIREDHSDPGITAHEASFLRLVELITNGTKIETNQASPNSMIIQRF